MTTLQKVGYRMRNAGIGAAGGLVLPLVGPMCAIGCIGGLTGAVMHTSNGGFYLGLVSCMPAAVFVSKFVDKFLYTSSSVFGYEIHNLVLSSIIGGLVGLTFDDKNLFERIEINDLDTKKVPE